MSIETRYPTAAILADLARAAIGLMVALAPFLLTDPVPWLAALLAVVAGLFLIFGARTALRARTVYRLGEAGLEQDGPIHRAIVWDGLTGFKLRFYSTRRSREKGWFSLTLKGAGGRISLESHVPEFEAIAQAAAWAAFRRDLPLDPVTLDNLAALGIRERRPAGGLAQNPGAGEDG